MLNQIKTKNLFIAVLFLDIVVIILHLFFGREGEFFNLDKEYNLPASYSAIKLISIGIISLLVFSKSKKLLFEKKWQKIYGWLIFGLLFLYLGFDEFFTIHEKTIGYLEPESLTKLGWFSNHVFYWVPLFLPFIILTLILFYYFAKIILTGNKFSRNLFILGAVFFALVVISEFVGGFLDGALGYVLMTFEESFEVFGATFFLAGVFSYSKVLDFNSNHRGFPGSNADCK